MDSVAEREREEIFPGEEFRAVCGSLEKDAAAWLDGLTKPKGSLGRLEEIAIRLYAMAGGRTPLKVDPCHLYTVAGDHGIAARHVSPFPQAVTRQMVENFLAGGAAVNVLCRTNGIRHLVIDAGCAGGPFGAHNLLVDRRLGDGTSDISIGPAMSKDVCRQGLRAGFAIAADAARAGCACIALGEMGIANSTSATALFCALLGQEAGRIAGPGAGATPQMVRHKACMVARALAANADAVGSGSPLAILAALGGFEIVIIAGIMLGCASRRLPFLVDGFICTAAYAAAMAFFPKIYGYAFLSHCSAEPAFEMLAGKLSPYHPLLSLGMRLGEGTGAAVALPILRDSAAIFNEMATLANAGVSATDQDRMDDF